MKIVFYYLSGKKSDWSEQVSDEYLKKLSRYFEVEKTAVKSVSEGRENSKEKQKYEAEALLKKIQAKDYVVLFDEAGKLAKNSVDFSKLLISILSNQNQRIVFVIGGPYGFADDIKKRAQLKLSLGPLTMNHHLALVVALEQVYRAITIWKNIPYHNS
jgi:23S rRNA (pseudouridine1915-N3)-methyltransferase